jgi:hypothetical protein
MSNKLKIFIAVFCFFTLAASQKVIQTNNSYMLIPSADKKGPEVILLGLNGAFCDPGLYVGMFQTIQNYSTTYKIWVALPIFPGDFASNLEERFPQTLKELRDQGANTTDVFVAGHSAGGFMAQDFLSNKSVTGYKGLILLGKFIKFEYIDPETNFPVPVLTIGGELDGLTKISRLAMSFNQMLSHPKGLGHIYYPVAIVPGAYHSSYITGDVPPVILDSDIKNETTGPEVWAVCAKLVDAFMNVQLNIDSYKTAPGAQILFDYIYGTTYTLMKPLLHAFALEGNPYLYNASLINTTEWVALHIYDQIGLAADKLNTTLNVSEIRNLTEFYNETPTAVYTNMILDYKVFTRKEIGVVESDDISNPPNQSAIWISTKYKSPTFIFDISKLQLASSSVTCKILNQKVIDQVMQDLPNKTADRFQKWGVRLQAGDDVEYSDEASWNASEAVYEDHVGYIVFKSPKLQTDVKMNFLGTHDAEGGDFYCKLLSPAKVAEWVYCDGLRRYDGASANNSTGATGGSSSSGPPAGFPFPGGNSSNSSGIYSSIKGSQ